MMSTTILVFAASLIVSGAVLGAIGFIETARQARTRARRMRNTGFWQQRQERKRR